MREQTPPSLTLWIRSFQTIALLKKVTIVCVDEFSMIGGYHMTKLYKLYRAMLDACKTLLFYFFGDNNQTPLCASAPTNSTASTTRNQRFCASCAATTDVSYRTWVSDMTTPR